MELVCFCVMSQLLVLGGVILLRQMSIIHRQAAKSSVLVLVYRFSSLYTRNLCFKICIANVNIPRQDILAKFVKH